MGASGTLTPGATRYAGVREGEGMEEGVTTLTWNEMKNKKQRWQGVESNTKRAKVKRNEMNEIFRKMECEETLWKTNPIMMATFSTSKDTLTTHHLEATLQSPFLMILPYQSLRAS